MTARRTAASALAVMLCLATSVAGAGPASACTPHVASHGPTVTVAPDYNDPTSSQYEYDADGTYVQVVTCLG